MALVKRQIEKELADYSYLNVPTVKPSFDFLNQVDSNDSDELIDLDEIFGDDWQICCQQCKTSEKAYATRVTKKS